MFNIRTRRRGIGSSRRRTVFAGNWPYALRLVPGFTKMKQPPKEVEIEIPEEPVEVSSARTGRYTIKYIRERRQS